MTFQILDCTLRDGGYYTNWDFSSALVEEYYSTVAELPVDYVEIGYRSPEKTSYFGRYFFLSRDDIAFAKSRLRADQKIAVMLNAKDCQPEQIQPLLEDAADLIDIIRFACPPSGIDRCLELARQVSALDIEVAINIMYLNTYADDTSVLAPLSEAGNYVQYVALVDSYGSCTPDQVGRAVAACTELLPQKIGFHGHDNISLAFANSRAAIDAGASIADATMTGMGRGAGNLTTELAVSYYEKVTSIHVNYSKLAHLLETFNAMKREYGWGTSLPYMISGINGLPQAQVMDWLGTKRYTASSIVSALRKSGNLDLDETAYQHVSDRAAALGIGKRPVVIVGGGATVTDHLQGLSSLVAKIKPVLIYSSLRYLDKLPLKQHGVDELYCLPGQEAAYRLKKSSANNAEKTWIVSAPPRFADSAPDTGLTLQVETPNHFEEAQLGPVSDTAPLELALAAASSMAAERVMLIGCDGYAQSDLHHMKAMAQVDEALAWFKLQHPDTPLFSLTPTGYDTDVRSLYSLI